MQDRPAGSFIKDIRGNLIKNPEAETTTESIKEGEEIVKGKTANTGKG